MRYWFVFPALALAAMSPGRATAQQISMGLRGGVNFSSVAAAPNDLSPVESRQGKALALLFELAFSDRFALQPELAFSEHGFRQPHEAFSSDDEWRYTYLQFPLLAKMRFGTAKAGLAVLAGPHLGVGIGFVTGPMFWQDPLGEEFYYQSVASWRYSEYRAADFGLTGGIEGYLAAGIGTLGLDLRYQHGLSNMLAAPGPGDYQRNRNLQLGLSYLIRLGKAGNPQNNWGGEVK
jgi:hypothetical protein